MLVPFVKSVGNWVATVRELGSEPSVEMPPTFVNLNSVPEYTDPGKSCVNVSRMLLLCKKVDLAI